MHERNGDFIRSFATGFIHFTLQDVSASNHQANLDGWLLIRTARTANQFSGLKNALADLAVAKLEPIASEIKRLQADRAYVESVLADGSARARAIAAPIMAEVRNIVGYIV